MALNDWAKSLLMTSGGGTFVVLLNGLLGRKTVTATTDSIVIQSSTAVIGIMRSQMDTMQTELVQLRIELVAARRERRSLERHVDRLEEAIINLGGNIPPRTD